MKKKNKEMKQTGKNRICKMPKFQKPKAKRKNLRENLRKNKARV